MMEWSIVIPATGLAVTILLAACGVVWKIARTEIAMRAEFAKEVAEIKAEASRETLAMHERAAKEVAALQAKVYQVEIWVRDEFVRKGSFDTVVNRLEKSMELMGTKFDAGMDRMSAKIDLLRRPQPAE